MQQEKKMLDRLLFAIESTLAYTLFRFQTETQNNKIYT